MSQSTRSAWRGAVRVPAPDVGDDRPDYADAFEVRTPERDDRTAELWIRAGLEGAPGWMRWVILLVHRHVLGFRLGPPDAPDHVLGWPIVASEPDEVRLEASSRLLRGVLVGRRVDPSSTRLTTLLFFERPATARVVWAVIGPLHRRIAPYLLTRAAGVVDRAA
jgi:hypothetical protein